MSNEKRNVETEEIKEARELTEEDLEQVTGGSNSELDFQLGLEYVTTQK